MNPIMNDGRGFAVRSLSRVMSGRRVRPTRHFAPFACLLAAVMVVPAFAADSGSASAAPTAQAARATARVVLRPVNARGRPVPGYRVTAGGTSVDCSSVPGVSAASRVTVSRNVDECSPSAAYAVACWRAAFPRRVLCFFDARHRHLVRYRLQTSFAASRPPRRPAPLDMRLRTGVYCEIRDGGAGNHLRGHPNWFEFYLCTHRRAVWAPGSTQTEGVNMTRRVWRVHMAPESGRGRVVVRRVRRAWFVGTRG